MTEREWCDALPDRARTTLPPAVHAYVEAGAWRETSRDEAETAWASYRFLPRVLRDVSSVSTATSILGLDLATPIAVAPSAMQRAVHPDGEKAMARGAAAVGALHVVSSNAGFPFAEIPAEGPWWAQVYVHPDRTIASPFVRKAAAAGASALVLTVDTPRPGPKWTVREEDWEGIDLSWWRCNQVGADADWATDLTVADIAFLREESGLPVVVKGVLRPDDALACVEAGAAAVYVSNHGGRQLDRTLAPAHALPGVVEAVDGRVPVLVDGGVRTGLDALCALALGADVVLVGRPAVWALAAEGAEGVRRLLAALTDELVTGLRLSGSARVADAREIVAPQRPSGL